MAITSWTWRQGGRAPHPYRPLQLCPQEKRKYQPSLLTLNTFMLMAMFRISSKEKQGDLPAAQRYTFTQAAKALLGKPDEFSLHGLSGYFTSNRWAKIVMVMLNP